MNRQAIIERVKIKLDEYTPLDEGVDHPLNAYFEPLLDEAVKDLLLKAPLTALNATTLDSDDYSISVDDSVATITISLEDAYRIVGIKVSDWKREVSNFEVIGSARERMQANEFVRGTINRPVVSIQETGSNFVLNCYTTDEDSPTATIRAIVPCDAEDIDDSLLNSLVLLTAAKVALSTDDQTLFSTLYNLYKMSLQ